MPDQKPNVFDAYAAYYDLLYRDKDYAGEAAYVHGLIQHHAPGAQEVLELGSGTGGHAVCLAGQGYRVTGVDRSEAMVRRARDRVTSLGNCALEFAVGDLRNFRAGKAFDVVLALFHVMSYQTGNADLQAAMATASAHLRPGGLFIFDCWYGPGVLTDPPCTRIRRMQGDCVAVTRIAEPDHRSNENRVDVHYEVIMEGPLGLERICEVHAMRYLFALEVDMFLEGAGLRRLALTNWLGDDPPGLASWNACFIATK
ncbi:MAG: class I SAM-dependent methyltransferase [Desulfobulbus sp.]|nr:class I SAM-dependent methyltransferase [Desulfobulbus sp.]